MFNDSSSIKRTKTLFYNVNPWISVNGVNIENRNLKQACEETFLKFEFNDFNKSIDVNKEKVEWDTPWHRYNKTPRPRGAYSPPLLRIKIMQQRKV